MSGWELAAIIVGAVLVGGLVGLGSVWLLLTYDVETFFRNRK